jgi:hypothetical protein
MAPTNDVLFLVQMNGCVSILNIKFPKQQQQQQQKTNKMKGKSIM